MTGVFMALGAGYEEAREEIQNEAAASGLRRVSLPAYSDECTVGQFSVWRTWCHP